MVDVETHNGRHSKSLGKEPNEQVQADPCAVASEEQLGSPLRQASQARLDPGGGGSKDEKSRLDGSYLGSTQEHTGL